MKTEKKFRFNIVDALILLVILGAVLGLVYIFSSRGVGGEADIAEVIYKIELKEIRNEFRGKIQVGDTVVDSVALHTIGEVIGVEYTDSIYVGENHTTGALVYSSHPGETNIIVTVRATANKSGGMYMIDNYYIATGVKVSFRVPNYIGYGYCTEVNEVTKN